MARTTEYLIVRYGSNAANQHLCQRAPVAIVAAANQDEAKTKATKGEVLASTERNFVLETREVSCYNNQHLQAIPRSRARASEWDSVLEQDAMFGDN